MSKPKNIFAKGYFPNYSEEVLVIKHVQNTVPWTHITEDLNGKEIVVTFYKKEFQKPDQTEFRPKIVITRKGNKLYVKWKGYNNSFNSCLARKV